LPVFHDGPALEYVTFADAQKDGSAEITEVGSAGAVSTLEVTTSSNVPVLMIDGEILIGLQQNRVLNTTILVPAKTTLKVPVACVEAGRWRRATSKANRADYALSPIRSRFPLEHSESSRRIRGRCGMRSPAVSEVSASTRRPSRTRISRSSAGQRSRRA
jgi:hypothetical protein